ncbi:hypothetical protein VUR80DRAFT_2935 [Thermomyces stellatus]
MKFTGLAFSTLAASVLATPIYYEEGTTTDAASPVSVTPSAIDPKFVLPTGTYSDNQDAGDVPAEVTSIIAQQPAASDVADASPEDGGEKTVKTCEEVIALLEEHVDKVQSHTGSINETLEKVESGDVSKEDAIVKIVVILKGLKAELTVIVSALTGAVGVAVNAAQLDKVLLLVKTLLTEIFVVIHKVVEVLGLTDALTGILKIVIELVCRILTLLIGIVGGLLPGLLKILNEVLSGLTGGVLEPILAPVLGLLSALGGLGGLLN